MGFLDALFGGGKKLKGPAPDRIFAMVTAQITLETSLGLKHKNAAGIVFQPLATGDFQQIVRDTEELLRSSAEDTGTRSRPRRTSSATAGCCCATPTSTTWSRRSTSSRPS